MQRYLKFLPWLLLMLIAGCGKAQVSRQSPPAATVTASMAAAGAASADAMAYLDAAIYIIRTYAIESGSLDWTAIRAQAHAQARDAQTPADTYPAIRAVVARLGDPYSTFYTADEWEKLLQSGTQGIGLFLSSKNLVVFVVPNSPAEQAGIKSGDVILAVNSAPAGATPAATAQQVNDATLPIQLDFRRQGDSAPRTVQIDRRVDLSTTIVPAGRQLDGGVGYIEVPPIIAKTTTATNDLATRLQQAIQAVDQAPSCGWIVDLRRNSSGNIWPMLAGIGPILGEGKAGFFVAPNGSRTDWAYENGGALNAGSTRASAQPVYALKRASPPVAVLTSTATSGSGELLAVSFRGRPNTRSFGEATHGGPLGISSHLLSDGAVLDLSDSRDADRTGATYSGPLAPDQSVPFDWGTFGTDTDATLQAAATWLRSQPACGGTAESAPPESAQHMMALRR